MTGRDGQQQEVAEPCRDWPVGHLAEIDAWYSDDNRADSETMRWDGEFWRNLDRPAEFWSPAAVVAVRPLRPIPAGAVVLLPCSECQRLRSTDPESEEGMSGMCLRCLHGAQPVADPGTLSDPELSEGERAAYLGSPAPRDGLAGSDEVIRLHQEWHQLRLVPRTCGERCDFDAIGGFVATAVAARVRAEAVAAHRADLQHRIEVSQQYENERRVALAERDEYHRNWHAAEKRTAKAAAEAVAEERQRIASAVADVGRQRHWMEEGYDRGYREAVALCVAAAGSVPVATPKRYPAGDVEPCTSQCAMPAGITCAEWGCRPVATPPQEPRPRCEHGELAEHSFREPEYPKARSMVTRTCSGPDSVAAPSVGTGTPAEEVSVLSEPALAGELAVIQQALLDVKGWSQGRNRPAALLAAMLTALDAVDRLARTGLGEVGQLTAEVARLRRERNQALQRELEAVCRYIELTADVACYRAAIEQIKDDAQTVVPDPIEDRYCSVDCSDEARERREREAALIAASGPSHWAAVARMLRGAESVGFEIPELIDLADQVTRDLGDGQ